MPSSKATKIRELKDAMGLSLLYTRIDWALMSLMTNKDLLDIAGGGKGTRVRLPLDDGSIVQFDSMMIGQKRALPILVTIRALATAQVSTDAEGNSFVGKLDYDLAFKFTELDKDEQ